jgi:vitamin B12 transporter
MLSTRERNSGKPRTNRAALLAAAVLLAIAGEAAAQTALEPIVVESGTLSGEPVDAAKLGSSVTVITAEELERRQIRNAADALRTVPGLAVGRTGSVGALTQVRIRGAEGNQVKVIIDGVEMNSLDFGDFDFATLLATDIERIEVIRGPQSGLYGANALSGVINIVTKKGGAPRVTATAEAGSLNTSYLAANASAGSDKGYLSVSAARRETDGYNIARSGTEADGSKQQTVFARGGFAPTDYFRIDAMGRFQSNFAELDRRDPPVDTLGATDKREQLLGSVSLELDPFNKSWTHRVFADHLDDDYISATAGSPFSPFTAFGERSRYGYLSTFKFDTNAVFAAGHTLVGLVERVEESAEFSFEGRTAKRSQEGYALEYRGAFADQLFLTGNIRHDDKDAFDDATTYRLSAAYLFPNTGTRLHGSYGKGITDPTFFELFGRTSDFFGNPSLKPEESIGWDFGVEQKFLKDRLTVDLTYFQADLKDEITGFSFGSFTSVKNQLGTSERQGVEFTLTAQVTPALLITGSYTYTDASEPDGSQEIRRPRHSGAVGIAYSFADGRGRINADSIYNGEMKDRNFGLSPAPLVTLDDYLLVNMAASYKLDDHIELFGRAENLLDTSYEEVFGYSSQPFTAYGGVRVTFEADRPLEPNLK